MTVVPESKTKMLDAVLSSDAVFMVAIEQPEVDEDGQISLPIVRALTHELPASHFSTVLRATSKHLGDRMDYILLDYIRLLQQEKDINEARKEADSGEADTSS